MNRSEKFWDMLANNFDKYEDRFKLIHNKTIQSTKKYLNPDDIVLDYGCATGGKTLNLARSVKMIHGIDISSKMIKIALRKKSEQKIDNVLFSHTPIFDESLKKGSLDVIVVFNILHLLEDLPQILDRIKELLKPGGRFISTTPCLDEEMDFSNTYKFRIFLLLKKIGIIPQYLKRFCVSELEDLIADKNFQILETEKMFDGLTSCFIAAKKF